MIMRDMTLEKIFKSYPGKSERLSQELANAGLHCVGCSASSWETIEEGMRSHGMEEEEIVALLKRLNDILSEKEDFSTITVTTKAAQKFLQILEDEGKCGWALRFGEKAAGCSGFEYFLDFSEKPESDDVCFESNGVRIHVQQVSLPRLAGSVIDYVEGLHSTGFKVSNPHVKSSCKCGNSHGYDVSS